MNHYVNIMNSFEEKGKDDIPTDEELLLFSESDEDDRPKKVKYEKSDSGKYKILLKMQR